MCRTDCGGFNRHYKTATTKPPQYFVFKPPLRSTISENPENPNLLSFRISVHRSRSRNEETNRVRRPASDVACVDASSCDDDSFTSPLIPPPPAISLAINHRRRRVVM